MNERFAPYIPRLVHHWPEGRAQHQSLPGSMVFVDISGFTAMSERLARFGKLGAEEVVAVLNRTFAALITTAAELGGDLLKFGGDALLLWFEGTEHELQAAAAGAAMRNQLRVVGKQKTAAGNVALKMTVGVHTGEFDFFLVGNAHRELIIAGPAATTTVATEESAEAGQVMLSQAMAKALPKRYVGEPRARGRLLRGNPAAPATPISDRQAPGLENFVPAALRPVVGRELGQGEHRPATIAFVKYTGIDRRLEKGGADRLARDFDQMITAVQEACDELEVTFLATDVDRDGGKVILVAGVPKASDADEERMLLAVRKIIDSPRALDIKIGVNRGRIFAADVGADFRRSYTIIGDDVNLAARVMSQAEKDQILATLPVIQASRTKFEATPISPFRVKGKSEPVVASAIGRSLGTVASAADVDLPLFGRQSELTRITTLIDSSRDGTGAALEVTGPPGIGKSRIVDEAVATSPELEWHVVVCERYHRTTPYFSAGRLLRMLLGVEEDSPDSIVAKALDEALATKAPHEKPWRPLIGEVLGLDLDGTKESRALDDKFRQARTQAASVALVAALVDSPMGVVVNNSELMDDLSAGFFSELVKAIDAQPITLLAVRRPEDSGWRDDQVPKLEIGPLSQSDATSLVNKLREENPLIPHTVAQIVDRAEGNPLFLIELAMATETGDGELPDSVEATVAARIDRVAPEYRQLLRYAAAVGRAFSPELLAEAIGDAVPEVADRSAWRALSDFLETERGTGRLRFRQKLYRHVAYAGLPFRTRNRLHERIGRTLEARAGPAAEEEAEILATHFELAGDAERTWRYARIAADRARAKWANVTAGDFYRRARRAGKALHVRAAEMLGVAEAEGDAFELAAQYDDARAAYQAARQFTGTDNLAGSRLMHKRGVLEERAGRYPQALRWYSRGLSAIGRMRREGAGVLRVELLVAYAGVRYRQGRYADTATYCRRAISDAERLGLHSELAHAYYLLSHALDYLGASEGDYEDKALQIYRRLGDHVGEANVYNNQGARAYAEGRWDESREIQSRNREARAKAGDVIGAAIAEFNVGLIEIDQGRLDEAESNFEDVLRVFKAARYLAGETAASANLGIIASKKGKFDSARELLEKAESVYAELGAERFVQDTRLRLAELAVYENKARPALRLATGGAEATEGAAGLEDLHIGFRRAIGLAHLIGGRQAKAREVLLQTLTNAQDAGQEFEALLTMHALTFLQPPPAGIQARLESERTRLGVVRLPPLPETS